MAARTGSDPNGQASPDPRRSRSSPRCGNAVGVERRPAHRVPGPQGVRPGPPAPVAAGGGRRVRHLQEHARPLGRRRPRPRRHGRPAVGPDRHRLRHRRPGGGGQVAARLRQDQPQPHRQGRPPRQEGAAGLGGGGPGRRGPREVVLAQFAGALAAPLVKMAGLLQALPRNFAYGLKALLDQKAESEPPPPAPPEPAGAPPARGRGCHAERPRALADGRSPPTDGATKHQPTRPRRRRTTGGHGSAGGRGSGWTAEASVPVGADEAPVDTAPASDQAPAETADGAPSAPAETSDEAPAVSASAPDEAPADPADEPPGAADGIGERLGRRNTGRRGPGARRIAVRYGRRGTGRHGRRSATRRDGAVHPAETPVEAPTDEAPTDEAPTDEAPTDIGATPDVAATLPSSDPITTPEETQES